MATLSEKIIEVNALGRQNLTEKGVDVPEDATTYEIMQSIAEVSGGGSAPPKLLEYKTTTIMMSPIMDASSSAIVKESV